MSSCEGEEAPERGPENWCAADAVEENARSGPVWGGFRCLLNAGKLSLLYAFSVLRQPTPKKKKSDQQALARLFWGLA